MSFPTSACTLPTSDEVALACRVPVRRVQCYFRDARRTKAGCRFEAAVPEWRVARGNFTFRFSVGGDGGVHADHFTLWIADRACRLRGPEGTDVSSRPAAVDLASRAGVT